MYKRQLPYAYDALEPFIGQSTLHFHHDKHLKTYVDNLNKTLAPYPHLHNKTLEELLCNLDDIPENIRNYEGTPVPVSYTHLERVYKEDLYVRTPKILDHAVKILLGGQLRQLMSEVDCENSDLKRAGSL